jgi:hypothetical protein
MSSVKPPLKANRRSTLVREFHAGRCDVEDAVLTNALHIKTDADERLASLPALPASLRQPAPGVQQHDVS